MKNSKYGKSRFMAVMAVLSIISAVMMAVTSVLSSCLVVKLFRYIHTAQRALPEIEKAARLYRKNNTAIATETKKENE
nr:hypothetical protein [uncultured Caproiciproducens sp.]